MEASRFLGQEQDFALDSLKIGSFSHTAKPVSTATLCLRLTD